MFEFIRGKLVHINPSKVLVDVGGIGYGIVISLKTYQKLPCLNEVVFFYTCPIFREDSQQLFGFLTLEEKILFEQIKTVNGIGPKTAIGILGHMDQVDFQSAIIEGNALMLSKIPGIGKKTAERLILDLKDKIKPGEDHLDTALNQAEKQITIDAISALINLGYNPVQSQKVIKKIIAEKHQDISLSFLITTALRLM